MTDPQNTETSAPTVDAPAPPAPAAAEAAPSAESPREAAPAASETNDSGDGDTDAGDHDDAGEAGEAGDDAGEAGGAGAQATTEGGAPKKRRRRRRKKKGPLPDGQVAADGTPAPEGAEGAAPATTIDGGDARPPQKPRPRRERSERERPAFNVGDVVFGKVTDVTEDALFVDLSGKARAIFDIRELAITEDDVEEYTKADKREADELAAARANAPAGSTPAGESSASTEIAVADAGMAEGTEAPVVETEPVAAVSPAPPAEAAREAPAEATEPGAVVEAAPAEGAPAVDGAAPAEGEAPPEDKTTQLPRVIMEPGAPFVGLVHNDGGRGGLVVLTHHPKRVQKAKPVVAEASRSGALLFGLVTGTIKGGVEVDVDGLRAFAPASHVELRPGSDLSHLVGKRLPFAVTQYAKRGRDVVLSRRAMLENEAKERRDEALKNIKMGSVVDGVVRTIVPFGAFIDVGGVEGLVPLSEMSHNRADQPKDVFKLNETVQVKILRLDERGKLWLSRRDAAPDPWGAVAEKYALGTRHTAKVVRIQPFGAFVELEPGIDGLIHSADLSVKRIEHAEEVVKIGEELEVVVANIDARQHRIALHPAPTGEAANEEAQKVKLGNMVKVFVVQVESGGLVVRVLGATGRNARGFISSAATGTPRGTELRKLFPVGKQLDVKITEYDPRRGELKLSIKALAEETERNAYQQYRAQVKREAKFGTFADLLAKRNEPSK